MNKKLLAVACAAVVLGGCASRPMDGPGSGAGASYQPMVQPHQVGSARYEADVAECQKGVQTYTYPPSEHGVALALVNATVFTAAVLSTSGIIPTVAAGGATTGGLIGFNHWVRTPERAAWHARQETGIVNCMTRKGYANMDPSVQVTWKPWTSIAGPVTRRTGVDTYNAEQLAKARRCSASPLANLIEKGPGYERHSVACDGGRQLLVRCEFGNCRAV